MIIDDLLQEAGGKLEGRSVADVRIGMSYTAVMLDDESCGLAGTIDEYHAACCTAIPDAGNLIGKSATEVATFAVEPDPVAAAVGMATLNAALNRAGEKGPDAMELLPVDKAKVGMIGHFGPYVAELRMRASELLIFERKSVSEGTLPDWAVERLLPECDVVIATSITLVNKTLDHLLDLATGVVALVGPTTPMTRSLAARGVSHLFGVVVTDPDRVLTVVSQAGGTHRFRGAVKKVHLDLRDT